MEKNRFIFKNIACWYVRSCDKQRCVGLKIGKIWGKFIFENIFSKYNVILTPDFLSTKHFYLHEYLLKNLFCYFLNVHRFQIKSFSFRLKALYLLAPLVLSNVQGEFYIIYLSSLPLQYIRSDYFSIVE